MELQNVSIIVIVGLFISAIISVGIPILLLINGKKKHGAKLSSFFIGAGTFILFAMVLEQILHFIVIKLCGLNAESNFWLYCFYGALAAAVFEETGRIVAMKFFMKKSFDFPNAFMYGCGHGGVEAMIIGGYGCFNLALTAILINTGFLSSQMSALTADLQKQVFDQVSVLWTQPSYYFFMGGVERLFAIILHIGLSLIIFKGLNENKKQVIALAFAIHFLIDFVAVACANYVPVWAVEIIIGVMSIAAFMLSHRLSKRKSSV